MDDLTLGDRVLYRDPVPQEEVEGQPLTYFAALVVGFASEGTVLRVFRPNGTDETVTCTEGETPGQYRRLPSG